MITSKLQEAEFERDRYKDAINKIIDIMSWDDYDVETIEGKYYQLGEFIEEFISYEPTTADEFNKGDDVEYSYDK